MNIFLTKLIDILLSDPTSEIYSSNKLEKDGFCFSNKNLNCQLDIFSDAFGGYYFEIKYFKNEYNHTVNEACPTYRTEDFSFVKPILDRAIDIIDNKVNPKISHSPKYIELFRKILQGKPISSEYIVTNNEDRIELSGGELPKTVYIPHKYLRNWAIEGGKLTEPTDSIYLSILGGVDSHSPFGFSIPKYDINSYTELNKFLFKHIDVSFNNSADWENKLLSDIEPNSKHIRSIIDLCHLEQSLVEKEVEESKNINTIKKRKI